MPVTFDMAKLAPQDRAEALRTAIWDSVIHVDIDHHQEPAEIAGSGVVRQVGELAILSAKATALTTVRTSTLAREDSEPIFILGLQLTGSCTIVQGERQSVLRTGDMTLVDATRPYSSVNTQGLHHHYYRIPRADLALPDSAIRTITAVRLGRGNPVAEIAATYLERLADTTGDPGGPAPGADTLDRPSIELIRAVVATQLALDHGGRDPLEETLALRVMEYVRLHLGDRDLGAARLARVHHTSVRHLYTVLARSDIHLGDWIRAHRLEEIRKELARPRAMTTTIGSIARRWGFNDATNFGRAFREAYGTSPGEWRNRQRAHTDRSHSHATSVLSERAEERSRR
jgi:AraC-like DNA-binding protein